MWSPAGPHRVGFVDLDWTENPELCRVADLDPGHHVVARLYYPTSEKQRPRWTFGVSWLPALQYARGMGRFATMEFVPSWAVASLAWFLGLFTTLALFFVRLDLTPGAPLAPLHSSKGRPIVFFSHGLGGFRSLYSFLCSEIASQGFIVCSVEHTDGTAAAARLPFGKAWRFYEGITSDQRRAACVHWRVRELQAAYRTLRSLSAGAGMRGQLSLSHGASAARFLFQQVDWSCCAAVGHSFGGASVSELVATDPRFHAGVALDPWWPALPTDAAALNQWRTRSPLLIVGSWVWNTAHAPRPCCGHDEQRAVQRAARHRDDNVGGSSVVVIPDLSSHNMCTDASKLVSMTCEPALTMLGLGARLDACSALDLCTAATLGFVSLHLPLGESLRAEWNWTPQSGHLYLRRVEAREARRRKIMLPWMLRVTQGKGVLDWVSDLILERELNQVMTAVSAASTKRVRRSVSTVGHDAIDMLDTNVLLSAFGAVETQAVSGKEAQKLTSLLGADRVFKAWVEL